MAAGLGFKIFATGEVLSAANVNGYLMQGILVFATEAARDAAITVPTEGQFAFTKDTNSTWFYDGAAWTVSGAAAGGVNSNKVINGNFAINQRNYVSGATLASGVYGLDRWKSNIAGTTLTFTAAVNGNQLTINSTGGIQQVVEQQVIPAGNNTLSWEGTATARMYNSGATPPSYKASPITVNLDGLQNVVVEFTASGGTRTVSNVKLEAGTTASAFVLAGLTAEGELAACQRYFWRFTYEGNGFGLAYNTQYSTVTFVHPVTMRADPTATLTAGDFRIYYNATSQICSSAALSGSGRSDTNLSLSISAVLTAGQCTKGAISSGSTSSLSAEL